VVIFVEPSHSGLAGFYFVAVHPKEAIIAWNLMGLTEAERPFYSGTA
jgi:hypothetical protein